MNQDVIYLKAIKTESVIGILPHERAVKQTLIIGCELGINARGASENDDISAAVNYAEVVDFIDEFSRESEFKLLETFAEKLAEQILARFAPLSILLDVQKPCALQATREVGVRIYREA